MITSEPSLGSTWARRSASPIATSPSLCAGKLLSPPLKAPTGVRAALAITMSVIRGSPRSRNVYGAVVGNVRMALPGVQRARPPQRPPRRACNHLAIGAHNPSGARVAAMIPRGGRGKVASQKAAASGSEPGGTIRVATGYYNKSGSVQTLGAHELAPK